MCHSCVSRNPGNKDFFYCLDSRFRGNDTLTLDRGTAGIFIRQKCYRKRSPSVRWESQAYSRAVGAMSPMWVISAGGDFL